MKIVVINGTPVKGITHYMKELFLNHLREGNDIIEFYPKDMPVFCTGCKNCFRVGEDKCPHIKAMEPIRKAIFESDLLVFAYPVYALRAPASIKSLLDHLCVHWMVHRPEVEIFKKTAVVITNSIGAPNSSAQKDVKTSLTWMGVSKIYTCGAPMMGDIMLDKLTDKHREMLVNKMKRLAEKVSNIKPNNNMSVKVKLIFKMSKIQHNMVMNSQEQLSLDNEYFIKHGWIKPKK